MIKYNWWILVSWSKICFIWEYFFDYFSVVLVVVTWMEVMETVEEVVAVAAVEWEEVCIHYFFAYLYLLNCQSTSYTMHNINPKN